jgi:hypothetical protein
MRAFFQKHKERLTVLGVVLGFFIFAAGGLFLQGKNRPEEQRATELQRQMVVVSGGSAREGSADPSRPATTTSYHLKPSPSELLTLLTELAGLNPEARQDRLQQFRILWPLYFFRLEPSAEGPARIVFDGAEDGFGAVVEGSVDTASHPQALALTPGEKVWVGGQIVAADPSGTGTIYLAVDHLTPGEAPPFAESGK